VPSAGLSDAVRVSAGLLSAGLPAVADAAPGSGSVPELLARAEEHRRKREFQQACALYAAVAAQGGMTADAWADYADAQASVSGRLAGAPARAIEAALLLEPGHAKALWLKASLAHEERRYTDALKAWRQLQALVPPGSSDAKIIQANIAEASRLAAG
jgi:cytochrome c-type biogenesis protein CcmH